MSNESSTQHNDIQNSSGFARRDFLKYSTSTLAWIYLGGCNSSSDSAEITGYSIDATVLTTRQRTVMLSQSFSSTILPKDLQNISAYDGSGYGVWSYGNGLQAVLRTDIMSNGYIFPSDNKPVKLLKFFAITDIHITDKESPSQVIYLQPANILGFEAKVGTSAYSPVILYSTHVLDAAIQTVNALHKQDPIDFGISLGDVSNNTQYNETRWYIDVLDGKVITPSSGVNVGAKSIDYQKPFKAAGLDPAIPWYQAIGNHDHFWLGVTPLDEELRNTYISDEVLKKSNVFASPDIYYAEPPFYYMGVIDGSTPTGTIVKAGPVDNFTTAPKIVPDVKRRSLTKAQWAQEFFNTSTAPIGHGLNLVPEGKSVGFACYSFVPKSTLPIKVIVLDDTQREDDGDNALHIGGFLDQERWNWLKAELAAGSEAGQLMIIATHSPIGVESKGTLAAWYEKRVESAMENAVTLPDLLAELHNHPNLLMWMAGHRHVNTVKAFKTDDVTKPERGFWHVETSSLRDFPQQFRLFEISLNSDYTISIDVTNVDPAVKEGTPAATSRKYAVATQQIVKTGLNPNNPNSDPTFTNQEILDPSIHAMDPKIYSYNAELLKQLSPKMITKMQSLVPMATA